MSITNSFPLRFLFGFGDLSQSRTLLVFVGTDPYLRGFYILVIFGFSWERKKNGIKLVFQKCHFFRFFQALRVGVVTENDAKVGSFLVFVFLIIWLFLVFQILASKNMPNTALNHALSNGVATGYIMFKAAYSQNITCHFLFILAHLLSGSISFYDFLKFHYFYANFKRARASNYCFQKECLKSLFNKDISVL